MKILNKDQIYGADQATITAQNCSSFELMERAAGRAFEWIKTHISPVKKVYVFCGTGNNGGDGLVIARSLLAMGLEVKTYVVAYSDKRSEDFISAKDTLEKESSGYVDVLDETKSLPTIENDAVVIDAIFGIGYNRPAPDWVQLLFEHINTSGAYVISIDIPSGLYLDQVPSKNEAVLRADMLLTFQVPKLVIFLPETGKNIKKWALIDINLDKNYLKGIESQITLIDEKEVTKRYKNREKYTHKGTYGHSIIIGGSYGKMGAVMLSAKACLKSGSGFVTTYIPRFAMPIL
ncbi:MAG: NAD(P)H-hydrate epimerase, partial [Leeuwenhoekiella sp.]